MKRPLKPIPVFRQNPGESQKRFFNRMERTAKGVIERSKYEDKYGVEVKQDEVTGETSVRDREKDEVDLAAEQVGNSRHFGPWGRFSGHFCGHIWVIFQE